MSKKISNTGKKHRRGQPTIGVLFGWQAYEGALNSFLSPLLNEKSLTVPARSLLHSQ